jgi:hypothetical protein
VDVRVIAARKRRQRDLVVPRVRVDRLRLVDELLHRPEPELVLEIDRVAEPALVRAAAHDLEVDPVVHDLGERDDRLQREVRVRERRHRRLLHPLGRPALRRDRRHVALGRVGDLVERRHVRARDFRRDRPEDLRPVRAAVPHLALEVQDLERCHLAVAEHDDVEEVRDRLGIRSVRPAADDERVPVRPLGLPDRDAGQVEHVHDVRVGELRLEREPQEVEVADRPVAVDREQRDARRAHPGLEVRPRREDPLA